MLEEKATETQKEEGEEEAGEGEEEEEGSSHHSAPDTGKQRPPSLCDGALTVKRDMESGRHSVHSPFTPPPEPMNKHIFHQPSSHKSLPLSSSSSLFLFCFGSTLHLILRTKTPSVPRNSVFQQPFWERKRELSISSFVVKSEPLSPKRTITPHPLLLHERRPETALPFDFD